MDLEGRKTVKTRFELRTRLKKLPSLALTSAPAFEVFQISCVEIPFCSERLPPAKTYWCLAPALFALNLLLGLFQLDDLPCLIGKGQFVAEALPLANDGLPF
jgi:hypothetical protein